MKKLFLLLFIVNLSSQLFAQANVIVEAKIEPELERRDAPNEKITEDEITSNIFSAPATIDFKGSGGADAVYYTWFIYKKEDTENPIARFTDKDIRYTFEQFGDYVVKLEVADQTSEYISEDEFSFKITISDLKIPNFFSPGTSPGSNDEFRVAYKSLIKFRCSIFNRWGVKLYESNDPAKGWDGRYKGKYVNTGVYFYVIEAEGADGVKYKKGGDINVFKNN